MNPRPCSLAQVAAQSDSLEEFGRHFQDWLHTIRGHTSRPQLEAAVRERPVRLARKFKDGKIADAWLAASAEHLLTRIGREAPAWTHGRALAEPWFAIGGTDTPSRLLALRDSPAPYKARNIFTPGVDLPLRLSAGRPAKSPEVRRKSNAARQRRFRQKLRQLART
jgi:hypothetical protein